jgi:alkylhydroperoxidase family enzyme
VFYHKKTGQAVGLNQAQLNELDTYEDSNAYDERQRLALRFAEQLTNSANVEPQVVEGLRRIFSDAELVQLAATVGIANFINRFNHAFDIEIEHPGRG